MSEAITIQLGKENYYNSSAINIEDGTVIKMKNYEWMFSPIVWKEIRMVGRLLKKKFYPHLVTVKSKINSERHESTFTCKFKKYKQ